MASYHIIIKTLSLFTSLQENPQGWDLFKKIIFSHIQMGPLEKKYTVNLYLRVMSR